MSLQQHPTVEAFLEWPEQKPYRELLYGTVREKTVPDSLHSYMQAQLAHRLTLWSGVNGFTLTEQRCIPEASGETHVVLPDVAWFSPAQLPALVDGPVRVAPTLAVEIVSKDDRYSEVQDKVMLYLAAGVPTVWVVDPRARNVNIYHSNGAPEHVKSPAVLAEPLLHGLEIPLTELFARLPDPSQPPVRD